MKQVFCPGPFRGFFHEECPTYITLIAFAVYDSGDEHLDIHYYDMDGVQIRREDYTHVVLHDGTKMSILESVEH